MKRYIIITLIASCSIGLSAQKALTLEQYRDSVIAVSKEVMQAKEKVKGAEYTKKASISGYLPKIDLAADASYDFVKTYFGDLALNPFNYSLGAVLTQNIYAGGGVIANRKIAIDQIQVEQLNEEYTIEQMYYQADVAYWQYAANVQVLQNAEEYLEVVKSLFNIINLRFDDGMVSKSDLLMVNTRLKEAELTLNTAQRAIEIAKQNFNILMQVEANQDIVLADSINTELPLPQHRALEDVLPDNSQYKIIEKNIDIQKQQVNQTRSNYNPMIDAGFKGGWGTPMINLSGNPIWHATVFLSVKYPLLQWGKRINTVRSAKTEIVQLELQQGIVTNNINTQLSNAWTNLIENYKQIMITNENLSISAENMNLNTIRYNAGQIPILDVLSSQLSWIQAQNNAVSAELSYKVAYAEYLLVIGDNSLPIINNK